MKHSTFTRIIAFVCLACLVEGTHVSAETRAKATSETSSITNTIDELVDAKLAEIGEKRNPKIDDDVFVRRIYLDVIGRIPTLEETQDFLNSKSKTKRADLIDDLLDSYGHVSRQFNYWADVLRVLSRNNRIYGHTYVDFIKDSLEENQPYDEFVRELLTAEGAMFDKDNGEIGYYLRDLNMPEDNMSNTVRVFLGTRLECAQCHDHPFDVWTQRDYFEMVAFTGGMKFNSGDIINNLDRDERRQIREYGKQEPEKFARTKRMLRAISTGVFGSGTGLARLPEGFMGSDGEEDEIITGKTMFDRQELVDAEIPTSMNSKKKKKKNRRRQQSIPGAKDIGSREAYAQWLTAPENPRFTTTIANRLWKQAMGLGLIEPVDTIDDSTSASNEPLMEYLAEAMVELDFDRQAFLRAIYNSRTYQSQATRSDIKDVTTYGFNGPVLRRMSAEQLWDSLITLALPDIDQRSEGDFGPIDKMRYAVMEEIDFEDGVSAEEILKLANIEGDAKQNMMREQFTKRLKDSHKEAMADVKMINKDISKARKKGDFQLVKQLMLKRAKQVSSLKSGKKYRNMKRASELRSPAPAGHFLREFGQSDRIQIENANTEPAVTQVLSMMNGFIEKNIAQDQNTVLMKNVLEARREDVIDVIYLTMLARRPTRYELKAWAPDFQKAPMMAYTDLIWMLANSNEFIFVR